LDLRSVENIHVLMASRDDSVITVYRNTHPPRH
jgi:hypothetical protein